MAREELARLLSCLLERGQSARCCDYLAEFESRLFAELLHRKNSFRWFLFFCFLEAPQRAAHKKQMPFLAGQGAWPSALSRARSLRLSERSGRPLTGGADGTGAVFKAGRAEETRVQEWSAIGYQGVSYGLDLPCRFGICPLIRSMPSKQRSYQ